MNWREYLSQNDYFLSCHPELAYRQAGAPAFEP